VHDQQQYYLSNKYRFNKALTWQRRYTGWAKEVSLTIFAITLSTASQFSSRENYENWLTADKVIAKIVRLTFLAHPVVVDMRK